MVINTKSKNKIFDQILICKMIFYYFHGQKVVCKIDEGFLALEVVSALLLVLKRRSATKLFIFCSLCIEFYNSYTEILSEWVSRQHY